MNPKVIKTFADYVSDKERYIDLNMYNQVSKTESKIEGFNESLIITAHAKLIPALINKDDMFIHIFGTESHKIIETYRATWDGIIWKIVCIK